LFVIHNPTAGARHPERLRRRVEAVLQAMQVRFEYAFTEDRGHGEELARLARERGFQRVLVAGGDGSVLEAVSALAGTDTSLALLPVGTGNQLAANLGLPKGLKKMLEVAVRGVQRKIDVGMLNGYPFTIIAGAGFDAEVVRPPSELKRRIGYLAYVHAATAAAFAPKVSDLRIVVDGEESTLRGIGVEVANMPGLAAPPFVRPVDLVPDGKPDDGLLDVCVLAVESTTDFVSALTAIVTKRPGSSRGLHYLRGREVFVEADPPLPVQIDGERLEIATPFTATVRPLALNVIVPGSRSTVRK
jgi:YegS/Rv2252/BmrU family lipid kinase